MNEEAKFQYQMNWYEEQPSLRDRIAIAALTGMATAAGFQGAPWERLAKDAYQAADAMLKARSP
jgi:hypothetical protein